MTAIDAEWAEFYRALQVGQIVDGVVVAHRPFGIFVDIGNPRFLAVVLLPSLSDEPPSMNSPLPPVGSIVRAVLLGFSGIDHRQPRLSMRPSVLEKAGAKSKSL